MKIRIRALALIVGGITFAATIPAGAGTVTSYSDIATFDAAHGPVTIETFTDDDHFPISSGVLNSATTEAGLTAGEIKPGGDLFHLDRHRQFLRH